MTDETYCPDCGAYPAAKHASDCTHPEPEILEARPWDELRTSGMSWLINQHMAAYGLRLSMIPNVLGQPFGWRLDPADEPLASEQADACRLAAQATIADAGGHGKMPELQGENDRANTLGARVEELEAHLHLEGDNVRNLEADTLALMRELDTARAITGHAEATNARLRQELTAATALNRTLTNERDTARSTRDTLEGSIAAYRALLPPEANDGRGTREAVAWLVADWRRTTSARDLDRAEKEDQGHGDGTDATTGSPIQGAHGQPRAGDLSGPGDEWAIVELLGHRRLAGRISDVQRAGIGMLRLDIPADGDDPARTQLINPTSIYCLHPCGEATARAAAAQWRPQPVQRWELPGITIGEPIADVDQDDDEPHDAWR